MKKGYDRYEIYRTTSGTIDQLPFVRLPENQSDKYESWRLGRSRLDKMATRYYGEGNDVFDFLILMANPEYISQFDIPDGTLIRIPFPLEKARTDYEDGLKRIRNR